MAIASILLHALPDGLEALQNSLQGFSEVIRVQPAPPDKLAVVLECPAEKLPALLKKMARLPEMLDLELVYANYEDDLDKNGNISVPDLSMLRRHGS